MTRKFLTVAILFFPIARLCAAPGNPAMKRPNAAPLQIQIKVNPEGRISVMPTAAPPVIEPCGIPIELPVNIVNQGFVTARLEAQLVGGPLPGVTLDFYPEPLKGTPQEVRVLRLLLTKASLADLTIAFRLLNAVPDLSGRERIHFLARCVASR